jgi:hypothetical protein
MMFALVVLCVVSLLAPCQAQDADTQPAAAAETLEVDIATVTKFPRSLDMMTRVWYLLFQACQEAKVNPASVAVGGAYFDSRCVAEELGKQFQQQMKRPLEGEFIDLSVSPQAFPGFLDALVKYGARRPYVTHTPTRAWAVFSYLKSWPNSSTIVADTAIHAPNNGGQPWDFFIIVETPFNGVMPPDVYQAISKYALPVQ